jgi:hypothetical protein
MRDPDANERHVIDAVKTLDSLATANGPGAAAAGTRFEIVINLGADHVEHYSKSIAINADDIDPNDAAQIPFASFKGEDDDGQ